MEAARSAGGSLGGAVGYVKAEPSLAICSLVIPSEAEESRCEPKDNATGFLESASLRSK
jgi:hypothetical protein